MLGPRHQRSGQCLYRVRLCADLLRYILAEHESTTAAVNLVELRHVLRNRFHASPELIAAVEAELRDETIVPKPAKPSPLPLPIDGTVSQPAGWDVNSSKDGSHADPHKSP